MKFEDLFNDFEPDEDELFRPGDDDENEEDDEDDEIDDNSYDDAEDDDDDDDDNNDDNDDDNDDNDNDGNDSDDSKNKRDKRDKEDSDEKSSSDKNENQSNGNKESENVDNNVDSKDIKDNLDNNNYDNAEKNAKEAGSNNPKEEVNDSEVDSPKESGAEKASDDAAEKAREEAGKAGEEVEKAGKASEDAGKASEEAGKAAGEGIKGGSEAAAEAGKDAAATEAGSSTAATGAGASAEAGAGAGAAGAGAGAEAGAGAGAAGAGAGAGAGAAGAGAGAGAGAAGAGAGAGAGAAGAGAGAGAGAAGGGGLGAAIAATMPWSLIIIAIIIVIILIIIIVSFFQTLPGSVLENLKRTVKEWALNLWTEVKESIGIDDNTGRISKEEVNDLAKYINDMGYDIQTYGFGDIKVKKDSYDENRVDKEVEDDGEDSELKVKSKYLKVYLAADECTYHFRKTNFLGKLLNLDVQRGMINPITTGGLVFNGDEDKLNIDRNAECLVIYNKSLDLPIVGFFKKLFTGTRAFQWGQMFRYDLNTWIGRYKRPIELFLAVHLSTMMPDLTYKIATDQAFNTQVDVYFEPMKACIKGNLTNSDNTNSAYLIHNGQKIYVLDIIKDYFKLFEVKKGWFDSDEEVKEKEETWNDWLVEQNNPEEIWNVFETLMKKYSPDANFIQNICNWFKDWKKISLKNVRQVLVDRDIKFDDEVNFADGHPEFSDFYTMFGCKYDTLASSNTFDGEGKFKLRDLKNMIKIWNDEKGYEEGDDNFLSLDRDWNTGGGLEGDPDWDIAYIDEGVKLKLKSGIDNDEKAQETITMAALIYKFGIQDRVEAGHDGIEGMLWPFVGEVKNHWYYKDIDFLGTSDDNATYRLGKVGYKTVQYSNNGESFEIPSAFYADKDKSWDFIVYQVAEPLTVGCNDNIKKVFSDKYYRYDGTEERAKLIAMSRAIDDKEDEYYYNGTEHDIEDADKNKKVEKEYVSMPDSPEKTLQSLAILKNMHSVASDYIYRDLKELYVKLEYYSKEEMTEALKLMMLWPIKVENKNEKFELVETHDKFGKAIVAYKGAEVLAPMDGKITSVDGGIEITAGTLNDEAASLLAFIFKDDFYKIDKDAVKNMTIRLSGVIRSVNNWTEVKRGQKIGTVNDTGKLTVTLRLKDKTVVEDITEYMREDHNNKYEEIMQRKRESKNGNLPAIPLRDVFGGGSSNGSVGLSIDAYDRTAASVTITSTVKSVYKSMKEAGYRDEQIAGVLGNMYQESGVQSNVLEGQYRKGFGTTNAKYTEQVDNGTWRSPGYDAQVGDVHYHSDAGTTFANDHAGYGLCQWTSSGRKARLKAIADSKSASVSDVDVQIALLKEELDSPSTWAGWQNAMNTFNGASEDEDGVMYSTVAFCKGFERPAISVDGMQTRISTALGYYEHIKNGDMD